MVLSAGREEATSGARPQAWARLALDLLAWAGHRARLTEEDRRRLSPAEGTLPELRRRCIDSLYYLSCQPGDPRQRLYDKVWYAQREALCEVVKGLRAIGVPGLVFKGAEVIERWYESRPIGLMADCDVLVPRPAALAAKSVLASMGYRQAVFDRQQGVLLDRDVADVATFEAGHYELAPFYRMASLELDDEELACIGGKQWEPVAVAEGTAQAIVCLDVHHAVALDIESGPFFERAVDSALGSVPSMSIADLLWFTASRYYVEAGMFGKESLRDLAYIAPMMAEDLDWDVVVGAARDYDFRPTLYYLLTFLGQLTGHPPPAEVLHELSPLRGSRIRDWGWLIGKLFGTVEPLPPILT